MKRSANLVLGVCAMLFGAAVIVVGKNTGLHFYRGVTPGTGFMPFIAAWGIGLCGLVLALGSLKPAKTADTDRGTEKGADTIWIFTRRDLWNFFVVIGASVLIVYSTRFLGMLGSLAVGVAVMAKFLGTPGWRTPILAGLSGWVMFYLIFDLFLRVPLPRGIFGL